MTPPTNKIEMACNCGKLRGHGINISPKTGRHIICMCKDCQAFARSLGRSDAILDAHGGTEIFQITPSQIKLEAGLEHLACTRLSPKGALRWYASCCNTPIANTTPSPAFPFAGVFCEFIKPRETTSKETVLGPIQQRFFGRDGYGTMPPKTQHKISAGAIAKTMVWMVSHKLKGHATPTPFFGADKTPVVTPTILTQDQRAKFAPQPG